MLPCAILPCSDSPSASFVLAAAALLIAGLLACPPTAEAQRKAGRNGAVFLEIAPDARSAAIGSAATSMTGAARMIFVNPAGTALPEERTASVSLSYADWLAGLEYSTLAVGYNTRAGTVTFGVQAFGITDVEANRENGFDNPALQELVTDTETSDTFNYLDLALSGSFARTFNDRISIGATFKYIRESIDGVSASAVAFDFGSTYAVGVRGWQIAARINNLGTELQFYNQANPLPLTFSIGSSIYPVNTERTRLMLSVDAVKPQDSQQLLFSGGELSFYDLLFLRGGYKFNYSGDQDGGTSARAPIETTIENFTLGAGLQYVLEGVDLQIDYAYSDVDLLDGTHRVSLGLGL
jgi:hypothetical protein